MPSSSPARATPSANFKPALAIKTIYRTPLTPAPAPRASDTTRRNRSDAKTICGAVAALKDGEDLADDTAAASWIARASERALTALRITVERVLATLLWAEGVVEGNSTAPQPPADGDVERVLLLLAQRYEYVPGAARQSGFRLADMVDDLANHGGAEDPDKFKVGDDKVRDRLKQACRTLKIL